MERTTHVNAVDGKQDLTITREFDLPLELLFKAHSEAELLEQWMGTKVLKLDAKKHGSWEFQTSDPQGNVLFQANGAIHEFIPNSKIIRTFEMNNAGIGVQLEIYQFEALSTDTSKLTMHVIYESPEHREQVMQFGFVMGINMAHNNLQKVLGSMKVVA